MAELISSNHAKRLPDFVDYPVAKTKLKACLSSAPVSVIRASFFKWSSDKNYDIKPFPRRKPKAGDMPDSILLRAHYDHWYEEWAVWVHPIRKTYLSQLRDEFETEGLARLAAWFARQGANGNPVNRQTPHFLITFDGQCLNYVESQE